LFKLKTFLLVQMFKPLDFTLRESLVDLQVKFCLISSMLLIEILLSNMLQGLIVDQTIEKVSFCAPDRNHDKGFSYICRDGTTRRWMCHGFLALKESVSPRWNFVINLYWLGVISIKVMIFLFEIVKTMILSLCFLYSCYYTNLVTMNNKFSKMYHR
jgi:hypothetical protein